MRSSICGWQTTQRKRSVGGNPLRLRGKTYERGVGTHAPGQISVDLAGGSRRFTALVGIDDEANGGGSSEFKVLADGRQIWTSGVVRGRDPVKRVDVLVTGVQRLDLIVTVANDGFGNDHTDWADAKFEVTGARPKTVKPPPPPRPTPHEVIQRQIAKGKGYWQRMAPETFHPASLIHETDRDAADVILRRTAVLLGHIRKMPGAPDLSPEKQELGRLRAESDEIDTNDFEAREKLFDRVTKLRRRIALGNPLLDFDKILFIKKHFLPPSEGQGNHMCDQYFGFHAIRDGGLFVLENAFSEKPTLRNILENSVCENGRFKGQKLDNGGFLSPDLSYNGKQVLFAYTEAEPTRYRWSQKSTYHIFKVNVDGSNLRQLTDGAVNDFDPAWMPDGRVVFISERRGGFGRCHGRPVPSFTLHSMLPDGDDIRCLSPHETNEWHPSIDNDGMIVYTRWDYVDRGFNQAHHPWITTPDGRDSRAVHGNFAKTHGGRPQMEMDTRAIPGSRKYVATACGHHGQAYGSLVAIDPGVE
ncbi:MAG: NPCBM/NEW2 domain-containing protein, partial [Phycisphaerae bacterium]